MAEDASIIDSRLEGFIRRLSTGHGQHYDIAEAASLIRTGTPVDIFLRHLDTAQPASGVYCAVVESVIGNATTAYILPEVEALLQKNESTEVEAIEDSVAQTSTEKYRPVYTALASVLYEHAAVGRLAHEEEAYNDRSDFFVKAASIACCAMKTFAGILNNLRTAHRLCQDRHRLGCGSAVKRIISALTPKAFLLALEHHEAHRWTSDESIRLASSLLGVIVTANDAASVEILLNPGDDDSAALLRGILSTVIVPKMSSGEWKLHPSMPHVFCYCLHCVRRPVMSDLLGLLFPPTLLLVDDFHAENRTLGLRCVHHVIEHCSRTELRWYGRADVLYDTVRRAFYGCDKRELDAVIACLLAVLDVVETSPREAEQRRCQTDYSKHDETFAKYLSDMEMESMLDRRRVYAGHLRGFVERLGPAVARHLGRLLRVIDSYLKIDDGPTEDARIGVLDALLATLHSVWPRVPRHANYIMKSLVRLLHDIGTGGMMVETPKAVKDDVVERAFRCVELLKTICPEFSDLDNAFFTQVTASQTDK